MRGFLDSRSASLTKYELAMEAICADRHGLGYSRGAPLDDDNSADAWDADAWDEYRKGFELKKARSERLARRARDLWAGARRDDARIRKPLARPLRFQTLAYPESRKAPLVGSRSAKARAQLPPARSVRYLKMVKMMKLLALPRDAPAATAYCEWRAPPRREILRAEAAFAFFGRGGGRSGTPAIISSSAADDNRIAGADILDRTGVLDAWVLRSALTPEYVPKLHLRRARAGLLARSAEFAALVRRRTRDEKDDYRLPVAEGGYSDDSDDEELVSLSGGGKRKRGGGQEKQASKRQRNGASRKTEVVKKTSKQDSTASRPKWFVRTYDSRAHDEQQMRAQARSRFCLAQQSAPRVEQPLWGARGMYGGANEAGAGEEGGEENEEAGAVTGAAFGKEKEKRASPYASTEDEALRMLGAVGIQLPTVVPDDENWRKEGAAAAAVVILDGEEEARPIGEIGLDAARQYRRWRKTAAARAFFEARNRYTRCRMYKERTRDKEITLTVRETLKFWKNRV
ncbi:hypothetical protein SLS62_002692 [Diatrype stigma]|uniref:Uncharacterized protein n=1 Tax=Diatrype stigma TaxID=117547 RepID=A0AAN9UXM4_9PEZI